MNSYEITHIIRQNPWRQLSYDLDYIQDLNILHCPHGHSKEDCRMFSNNIKLRHPAERFVQELKINNIVLIPYKKDNKYELLIARIKSACKTKSFSELKVVIHNNLKNKYNDNVRCVFSNHDLIKKMEQNSDYLCNTTIVPFETIYRDIEVLQRYNYQNNRDIRHLLSNVRQSIIKKNIVIKI